MTLSICRPQYFICHTKSQQLLVTRHQLSCEKVNSHNTLVTGAWDACSYTRSLFTLWSCAVSLTSYSQKVRFMSLDQNKEELLVDSFRPDPNSSGLQWFSAYFGSSTFLNDIYLADFLITNLTKFAAV